MTVELSKGVLTINLIHQFDQLLAEVYCLKSPHMVHMVVAGVTLILYVLAAAAMVGGQSLFAWESILISVTSMHMPCVLPNS